MTFWIRYRSLAQRRYHSVSFASRADRNTFMLSQHGFIDDVRTWEEDKTITHYIAELRNSGLMLARAPGGFFRWTPHLSFAAKFRTFAEAQEASLGYDIIIKTVEVNE